MGDGVGAGAPALRPDDVRGAAELPSPGQAAGLGWARKLRPERILAFFDVDDADFRAGKVATFQFLAVLGLAFAEIDANAWQLSAVYAACALASLARPLRRAALVVALAGLVYLDALAFPDIANHHWVQMIVLGLACALDTKKEEEQALLLQALRWLTIIVFFWAGAQKLLHGAWFDGRLLLYLAGMDPDAETAFRWLLPASEMERLLGYRDTVVPGPFRLDSPWIVVLSNLGWITEIAVAGLLLVPRTRGLAVPVGIGLMIGIEIVAREVVFGLLAVWLLCLFARRDWNRRLLPVYLALMAVLWGSRIGWLPEILWQ